jgi:hypothetical protein
MHTPKKVTVLKFFTLLTLICALLFLGGDSRAFDPPTCESCDNTYYSSCKPVCEAMPESTAQERDEKQECFNDCRSDHLSCSASPCVPEGGPYNPSCPSLGSCASFSNNCNTQCVATYDTCVAGCAPGDSSCQDVCYQSQYQCWSWCQAEYYDCLWCSGGGG